MGACPSLSYTNECAHNSYLTSSLDFETLAQFPCVSVPYAVVNVSVITKYGESKKTNKKTLNYHATLVLDNVCADGNMNNSWELIEQ